MEAREVAGARGATQGASPPGTAMSCGPPIASAAASRSLAVVPPALDSAFAMQLACMHCNVSVQPYEPPLVHRGVAHLRKDDAHCFLIDNFIIYHKNRGGHCKAYQPDRAGSGLLRRPGFSIYIYVYVYWS